MLLTNRHPEAVTVASVTLMAPPELPEFAAGAHACVHKRMAICKNEETPTKHVKQQQNCDNIKGSGTAATQRQLQMQRQQLL